MQIPKRTAVVFVTNSLVPGGAEHVMVDLVQSLASNTVYRPIVAALKAPGPLADQLLAAGIPVFGRLLTDKYDYKVIWRLAQLILDHRAKVVIPVGSGGDRMFWSTLSAALTGTKTVVWSHTYSQPSYPEFETANRVLFPLVARVIALGQRHKRNLSWFDKVPAGKITVIPNGIDVDRFDHSQWRDRARAILGLADENVTAIAMIANLRPGKRHDLFIRAASQIIAHRRDVHFFIIGDGANRQNVHRYAQQSDLLGRYLSLLGHRDDIATIMPGLDILCITSEYQECLSLAALQAMVARVPVVSHFVGSMDEAITDNETGFFFHDLSVSALVNRLIDVIDNPQTRATVSANAYNTATRKFSLTQMTNRFVTLLNELTTRHPIQSQPPVDISRLLGVHRSMR